MKILIFDLKDYWQGALEFFQTIPGAELEFFNGYRHHSTWVDIDGIIVRSQIGPRYPCPIGILVALEARAQGIPCVIHTDESAPADPWISDLVEDLRQRDVWHFGEGEESITLVSNSKYSRNWAEVWAQLLQLGLPYRAPKTEEEE